MVEHSCGHHLHIVARCADCGADLDARDSSDWSERFVAPGWDRHGPLPN